MTELTFNTSTRALSIVMLTLSIAEIIAVEIMVPWRTVRMTLTVVGLVSLAWLMWFLRAQQRRVHVVTTDEVVLRAPVRGEITIPMSAIAQVRATHKTENRDGVSVTGNTLAVATTSTTNVELILTQPTLPVSRQVKVLSSLADPVRVVRFYADDPKRAVSAVTAAITQAQ